MFSSKMVANMCLLWAIRLTGAVVFFTTCSNDSSDGSFDRREGFPSSMSCMSFAISDSESMVAELEL